MAEAFLAALQVLFLEILNMSLTASWVIAAVLLLRLPLRSAPKKWSYLLWSAAGFRLCCPVSWRSPLSLFRLGTLAGAAGEGAAGAMEYIPSDVGLMAQPRVNLGVPALSDAVSAALPAATPFNSANPLQIWIALGAAAWFFGAVLLLAYGAGSYLRTKYRLREAVRREGDVYETDNLPTPLILGLFRPRIYIPVGLEPEPLGYVLAHERCHLRRRDYLVKPLAFLLLAVHWFNPLVWLAFFLMCRDMEMSCDEAVLAGEGEAAEGYSLALLGFAVKGRFPAPGPLAFGETGVKARIKNVLRWKRPRTWVTAAALALVLLSLAALASNPPAEGTEQDAGEQDTLNMGEPAAGADAGEPGPAGGYDAAGPDLWYWTSTVTREDIKNTPEGNGVTLTEEETELLVSLLNALPPEAVSTGRGIPSDRVLDITTGPGYRLRWGGGIIEVDYADVTLGRLLYGTGIWEIHDEALYDFLEGLGQE